MMKNVLSSFWSVSKSVSVSVCVGFFVCKLQPSEKCNCRKWRETFLGGFFQQFNRIVCNFQLAYLFSNLHFWPTATKKEKLSSKSSAKTQLQWPKKVPAAEMQYSLQQAAHLPSQTRTFLSGWPFWISIAKSV